MARPSTPSASLPADSPVERKPSAVEQVFSIPELVERILIHLMDLRSMFCHLPTNEAQYFVLQRTSRTLRSIIQTSQVLRFFMCLPNNADDPNSGRPWTEPYQNAKGDHATYRVAPCSRRPGVPFMAWIINLSTGTTALVRIIDLESASSAGETDRLRLTVTLDYIPHADEAGVILHEGASPPPSWLQMRIVDNAGRPGKVRLVYRCWEQGKPVVTQVEMQMPQHNTMAHLCRAIKLGAAKLNAVEGDVPDRLEVAYPEGTTKHASL